jgi:hypothetical protein
MPILAKSPNRKLKSKLLNNNSQLLKLYSPQIAFKMAFNHQINSDRATLSPNRVECGSETIDVG